MVNMGKIRPCLCAALGLVFGAHGLAIELVAMDLPAIELVNTNADIFEQAVAGQTLLAGVELLLVEKTAKANQQVIPPTYHLKNGDHIRLRLRTSVASEYQLYVLDKQGQEVKSLLVKGQTAAATTVLLPTLGQGFLALDAKPGTEWLQLMVTAIDHPSQATTAVPQIRQQHPNGKIEQIILRNIELETPAGQKVQYDPLSHTIYFSSDSASSDSASSDSASLDSASSVSRTKNQAQGADKAQISLKLGLNHVD